MSQPHAYLRTGTHVTAATKLHREKHGSHARYFRTMIVRSDQFPFFSIPLPKQIDANDSNFHAAGSAAKSIEPIANAI
jgi:hypothetical protein